MKCRHCGQELTHVFANLWHQPASNSFLTKEQLKEMEAYFPLLLYVCDNCFLVQVDEYKDCGEIFNNDYVYFSSMSTSWLLHAKNYVEMMIERFNLNVESQVIEIASNDGYLLQYFKENNIPCLGVEPTKNTADVARERGIESIQDFFGSRLASELVKENKKADLILGNNVLAHVPDINDFVQGACIALKENGIITFEFPHLLNLIEKNQFDTIYQEHYSYLSLYSVLRIFEKQGLHVFDVEELPTHGGSLRIFACHENCKVHVKTANVEAMLSKEKSAKLHELAGYLTYQVKIEDTKNALLMFLLEQKKAGKKVAAYGAAAKGNTFLNICGIKPDLISFCVDKAASKQNKFMPGSHIPVYAVEKIEEEKPDFLVILPWNIKDEIIDTHSYIRKWNGKFVTAIPTLEIY